MRAPQKPTSRPSSAATSSSRPHTAFLFRIPHPKRLHPEFAVNRNILYVALIAAAGCTSSATKTMPIDIGYFVKPGDLIVQIDTTILHQQFVQATADYTSAKSNLMVAQAQLKRQQELYAQHIITLDVLETAQNAAASSTASEVRNHANVDLAGQALVDARVTATTTGTILTKPVSIGQVIQAGGTSVSGGTVIATMADLTK